MNTMRRLALCLLIPLSLLPARAATAWVPIEIAGFTDDTLRTYDADCAKPSTETFDTRGKLTALSDANYEEDRACVRFVYGAHLYFVRAAPVRFILMRGNSGALECSGGASQASPSAGRGFRYACGETRAVRQVDESDNCPVNPLKHGGATHHPCTGSTGSGGTR